MKKKNFLYGLLSIAVIAVATYNVMLNSKSINLSLTSLANIATLANAESLTQEKTPYTVKMDSIFALANKSRITTGLLSDYGLQLIEPEYFNGVPADSNYVDMDTWKMLYSGIYSSKINNNASLTTPATVFSLIKNATHATAVPVAMMQFKYNQLNEDALDLGLVQVVNNQIIDVPGAASPYLTKQLFAVAPKSLYFDEPTVRFVFKSNLWYTNSGKTIQSRQINFNNESGYITAALNTEVSYTFTTGGVKTIYFKLTYTDGTSYISRTNIHVKTSALLSPPQITPDMEITIAKNSQHLGGTVQIKFSSYNNTGQIKKPLIVAEGFDPSSIISSMNNINLESFLATSYSDDDFGTINVANLRNNINAEHFDIIYLDYEDGVDDIFRNAQLFRAVIDSVNTWKASDADANVVLGVSMGGLVARIALRQMEVAGQDHDTWKYISMDTPHKGANVPVGFQAMLRHIQNTKLDLFYLITIFDPTNIEVIKQAVDLLNSKAAQQMLIYSINSNYSFNNSVHDTFQNQYDYLGFPQQCINVAISNGSNNGSLTFQPNSEILNFYTSIPFGTWKDAVSVIISLSSLLTNYPQLAINTIPGNASLRVQLSVHGLNTSASQVYYGKVYVFKKLFWLIPVDITLSSKTVNSTSTMLPLDGAPGGQYSLSTISGGSIENISGSVIENKFCFVPTVSALAVSNWEPMLTQTNNLATPFDYAFTQPNNEPHTRFNSSATYLYGHLTSENGFNISGPPEVCSYTNFSIQGKPANTTVSWTHSSNLHLSANYGDSIRVVPIGAGNGWVQATVNVNGVNYTVPKNPVTVYGFSGTYKQNGTIYPLSAVNYVSNNPVTVNLDPLPNGGIFSWTPDDVLPYSWSQNISGNDMTFTPAGVNEQHVFFVSFTHGQCGTQTECYIFRIENSGNCSGNCDLNCYCNNCCNILFSSSANTLKINFKTDSKILAQGYSVKLFDSSGTYIQGDKSKAKEFSWNLSHLRKGLYIVNIYDSNGKLFKTSKFSNY
ncbi:MAG: NVEALA domain-containing protein [Dysgonamonadaceae bacterium]|jgi:hypothetical protein|nr:NVEALA domain-containing protein [Dysgonamonadaceae bacterium]